MKITNNNQCYELFKNKTVVYLCSPSVASQSKKLFSNDKPIATKIIENRLNGLYITSKGWFRIVNNNSIALFTTEEEANQYIENFKMLHYDEIRKILTKRKLDLLNKIASINERMKLLR